MYVKDYIAPMTTKLWDTNTTNFKDVGKFLKVTIMFFTHQSLRMVDRDLPLHLPHRDCQCQYQHHSRSLPSASPPPITPEDQWSCKCSPDIRAHYKHKTWLQINKRFFSATSFYFDRPRSREFPKPSFTYCGFGNFRMTFISRFFHFRIIREFLNSRASIRVVGHFRGLKIAALSCERQINVIHRIAAHAVR